MARKSGSGHLLWPQGCTYETVPADLLQALEQAGKIVNWYENLPSEEVPPEWMWPLDWELDDWFLEIKTLKDNNSADPLNREIVEMEENEYAARMRGDD